MQPGKSLSGRFGGGPACNLCNKVVYAQEKVSCNGKVGSVMMQHNNARCSTKAASGAQFARKECHQPLTSSSTTKPIVHKLVPWHHTKVQSSTGSTLFPQEVALWPFSFPLRPSSFSFLCKRPRLLSFCSKLTDQLLAHPFCDYLRNSTIPFSFRSQTGGYVSYILRKNI
jgi:hypothetical protein